MLTSLVNRQTVEECSADGRGRPTVRKDNPAGRDQGITPSAGNKIIDDCFGDNQPSKQTIVKASEKSAPPFATETEAPLLHRGHAIPCRSCLREVKKDVASTFVCHGEAGSQPAITRLFEQRPFPAVPPSRANSEFVELLLRHPGFVSRG